MAPVSSYVFIFATGLGLAMAAGQSNQCFFPDGSVSPTDFICNSTTGDGFSSCCGHQNDGSPAYCMSNGLCLSDMFLSRGSCSDKSWKSKNCAQVCTAVNTNGGVGIRPCGYTGKWDCGDGSGCSKSSINIPTGAFELTNAQLAAMGAVPVPSSSSPSSSPSTTLSASASTGSGTLAAGNSSSNSGSQLDGAQVLGLAVGLPLGLLACLFLTLWLLERRKTANMKQQLVQTAAIGGWNDGYDGSSGMAAFSHHQHQQQQQQQQARGPSGNFPFDGHTDAVRRAASSGASSGTTSQLGVHPAYRRNTEGYYVEQKKTDPSSSPPPPPPPPKTYEVASKPWLAEVPANSVTAHQRSSQIMELPAGQ